MGNRQSTNSSYNEIPTQSYINYVVKKNMDVWEKNISDPKEPNENINVIIKKKKKFVVA